MTVRAGLLYCLLLKKQTIRATFFPNLAAVFFVFGMTHGSVTFANRGLPVTRSATGHELTSTNNSKNRTRTTTEHRVGIGSRGEVFQTVTIDGANALLRVLQTTKTPDGNKIVYRSLKKPSKIGRFVRSLLQKGRRFELSFSGHTPSLAIQTESSSVELTADEQENLVTTIKTLSAINSANLKGESKYRVEPFVPGVPGLRFFKKDLLITDFVIRLLDGKSVGLNVYYGEKQRKFRFKQLDQFWSWLNEHESLLDEPNQIIEREMSVEVEAKKQKQSDQQEKLRQEQLIEEEKLLTSERKAAYDKIETPTKLLITHLLAPTGAIHNNMRGSWTNDSNDYQSLEEQFVGTGIARIKFKPYHGQKLSDGTTINEKFNYKKSFHSIDEIVGWAKDVVLIEVKDVDQ